MRDKLDAWIDGHRDAIIAETQAILLIPSVEEKETVGPGAPFGQPVADALAHTLALCARLGMATENFGGYAGHAEFGQGDEIVGMLGHLDVVPAGKDWTHDPWGGEVSDGYLWGRGTSDDKGPTYAALFGAKAVFDVCREEGIDLSRRIRLIFGCDEESGWQCMKHYFGPAGQEKPTVAFTPDASFPLIYAEKGSFTGVARREVPTEADRTALLWLTSFTSGLRPNMVPDEAEVVIEGDGPTLHAVAAEFNDLPGYTVADDGGQNVTIGAKGRSAHGSTPAEGENAAVKLIQALLDSPSVAPVLSETDRSWMRDIVRRGDTEGVNNNIGGRDDITGPLTSNLGILNLGDGVVEATFNVRYPARWDGPETTGRFKASLAETGWGVVSLSHTPPLYVPQDQEPVKTLLRVYREQTGDQTPPFTIGGRTYATVVAPVGVAFGPSMPGDEECAHQADERLLVERLIGCAKIYAQALYELAK